MQSGESLFAEVTSQQAIEYTTMASFVFAHFMNRIMDGIVAQLFSQGSDFFLASASALYFLCSSHFQVLLGAVGNDFAQQFSELGSVFWRKKAMRL